MWYCVRLKSQYMFFITVLASSSSSSYSSAVFCVPWQSVLITQFDSSRSVLYFFSASCVRCVVAATSVCRLVLLAIAAIDKPNTNKIEGKTHHTDLCLFNHLFWNSKKSEAKPKQNRRKKLTSKTKMPWDHSIIRQNSACSHMSNGNWENQKGNEKKMKW